MTYTDASEMTPIVVIRGRSGRRRLHYEPERTAYKHQASTLTKIKQRITTVVLIVVLCATGTGGEVDTT
jgi:hypothetical protein